MDKDFIYRQTLVWLEHEGIGKNGLNFFPSGLRDLHKGFAESLTNHLCNNFEQVQQATNFQKKLLQRIEDHPLIEGYTVRDTPEYYDRGE